LSVSAARADSATAAAARATSASAFAIAVSRASLFSERTPTPFMCKPPEAAACCSRASFTAAAATRAAATSGASRGSASAAGDATSAAAASEAAASRSRSFFESVFDASRSSGATAIALFSNAVEGRFERVSRSRVAPPPRMTTSSDEPRAYSPSRPSTSD
jgi:hypothetical protein